MCIEVAHDPRSLTDLTLELLRRDQYRQDIYIRPLAYKAEEGIGVRLHDLKEDLTIFALPFGQYVKNDTNAHVTISSWRRIDDNVIPATRQDQRGIRQFGVDQNGCLPGGFR